MALVDFEELGQDGRAVVGLGPVDITAENTFTDPFETRPGKSAFSIRGTFSATVSVQRSMDSGSSWQNLEQFTSPVEGTIEKIFSGEQFRIGVETGNYTSGTVTVEVKQ